MKKAYVITEGQTDVEILKRLLPKDVGHSIEFIVGSGRYSAQSLARSILATKQLPVALVLDAETRDEKNIQEQEEFLQEFLGQASSGTKFAVFLAKPELESSLVEFLSLAECLARHPSKISKARSHPKGSERAVTFLDQMRENLDRGSMRAIRHHPLISALTRFLRTAVGKSTQPVGTRPRLTRSFSTTSAKLTARPPRKTKRQLS